MNTSAAVYNVAKGYAGINATRYRADPSTRSKAIEVRIQIRNCQLKILQTETTD